MCELATFKPQFDLIPFIKKFRAQKKLLEKMFFYSKHKIKIIKIKNVMPIFKIYEILHAWKPRAATGTHSYSRRLLALGLNS